MKDKFCKKCGCKTYSESKGRHVMCMCEYNKYEDEE